MAQAQKKLRGFTWNKDGLREHEPILELVRDPAQLEATAYSPQDFLAARIEEKGSNVLTRELGGHPFHVARLPWPQQAKCSIEARAAAFALGEPTPVDYIRIISTFAMHYAVVKGPEDLTPFLSAADAQTWIDEPAMEDVVEELYNMINLQNPGLIPLVGGAMPPLMSPTG